MLTKKIYHSKNIKSFIINSINFVLLVLTLYFKKHLISATFVFWIINYSFEMKIKTTSNVIKIKTNEEDLWQIHDTRIKDIFYNCLAITLMFLNPLIAKLVFGGTIILTVILIIIDFIYYFALNKICTEEEQKEILKILKEGH